MKTTMAPNEVETIEPRGSDRKRAQQPMASFGRPMSPNVPSCVIAGR